MPAAYPGAIKTFTQLVDGVDDVIAAHQNERGDEITAIETELGVNPSRSLVQVGGIILYGGATAPTGWLLCNGADISRTTYAALFAVLGTAFGAGDGSTTFNLPDLRQRFPLGKADSGTGSTLGGTGGAIDHTHAGPSHAHGAGSYVITNTNTHGGGCCGGGVNVGTTPVTGTSSFDGTQQTGSANPPFQVVNYIIKH